MGGLQALKNRWTLVMWIVFGRVCFVAAGLEIFTSKYAPDSDSEWESDCCSSSVYVSVFGFPSMITRFGLLKYFFFCLPGLKIPWTAGPSPGSLLIYLPFLLSVGAAHVYADVVGRWSGEQRTSWLRCPFRRRGVGALIRSACWVCLLVILGG